ESLMDELRARDDVTLTPRTFGRSDRASTLARDAVWYPFLLRSDDTAHALHCPTYRGPTRARVPLVVTVHDLAVFRHPEAFNRSSRAYISRGVPRVLAAP